MRCENLVRAALILVLVTAGRCDPAWLAGVEKDLAAPGGGAKAVTTLEALPLPERQTRDYHWALARAFQADSKPGPAAEAVKVFEMLPPSNPARDIDDVTKWLGKKAVEEYKAAIAAQQKGDRASAVKGYLRAVLEDSAVQARDDKGLRDLGLRTMDATLAKKQNDPGFRFKHALYSYLFGRLPEAAASFDAYTKIEKQPYGAWRGKLWLDHVNTEVAAARQQDAKEAAADKARRAKEDEELARKQAKAAAEAATSAAAKPAEGEEKPAAGGDRKAQIQEEIAKLDQAINAANGAAAAAQSVGGKYGKIAENLMNGPAAQAKLNEMRQKKAALQQELSGLQ